jgi:hypothetical protein
VLPSVELDSVVPPNNGDVATNGLVLVSSTTSLLSVVLKNENVTGVETGADDGDVAAAAPNNEPKVVVATGAWVVWVKNDAKLSPDAETGAAVGSVFVKKLAKLVDNDDDSSSPSAVVVTGAATGADVVADVVAPNSEPKVVVVAAGAVVVWVKNDAKLSAPAAAFGAAVGDSVFVKKLDKSNDDVGDATGVDVFVNNDDKLVASTGAAVGVVLFNNNDVMLVSASSASPNGKDVLVKKLAKLVTGADVGAVVRLNNPPSAETGADVGVASLLPPPNQPSRPPKIPPSPSSDGVSPSPSVGVSPSVQLLPNRP